MKNYKRLIIIPARGGSKRIKDKNIKKFNGKPIIYYSIDSAKKVNFLISFTFQRKAQKSKDL